MKRAFEEALNCSVVIPPYHNVMGAIGSALLAKDQMVKLQKPTVFRGFDIVDYTYTPRSFECDGCPNICEVIELKMNDQITAMWGDRCGKWMNSIIR